MFNRGGVQTLGHALLATLLAFGLTWGALAQGPAPDQSGAESVIGSAISWATGPDTRLYALQADGTVVVVGVDLTDIADAFDAVPEAGRDEDTARREVTGIAVAGTADNPVVYVSSSGDPDREPDSGTVTRIAWVGRDVDDPNGRWQALEIVRGLAPVTSDDASGKLELDLLRIGNDDYLIVAPGGRADGSARSWVYELGRTAGEGESTGSLAAAPLESAPATGSTEQAAPESPAGPEGGAGVPETATAMASTDPEVSAAGAATWIDLNEDQGYTGRHECSFVQAGDKFYLFGGREQAQKVDTYDYGSDTWSVSAAPPVEFNHFQATEHEGLVWVIGAFQTNSFPNEDPADEVAIFDPANDVWMEGPSVPPARRRGGAGLVVHDEKFYVVGGNTIGHNGGYVPWFDVFDPKTGSWAMLDDAPHARDHFHAGVVDGKLYTLGGRLSGGPGGTFAPLIPEVDVYDFATSTWSTLPPASNIPTPRAAGAVAYFDGLIMVMGGEDDSQAWNVVEGLDPTTGVWQTLPSMNYTRHGTQAILSGQGVYILAGSPNKGGGNQKNMEVYNVDAPAGTASVAGQLSAPASTFVTGAGTALVDFDHTGGNQGVYVTDISLSGIDAPSFSLASPASDLLLVPIGGSQAVGVDYNGGSASASAFLDVTHSGGQVVSVELVPEPGASALTASGLFGLVVLSLRRRRAQR